MKPKYKPVCWKCKKERGLIKYHAAGGTLHICKKCAKQLSLFAGM